MGHFEIRKLNKFVVTFVIAAIIFAFGRIPVMAATYIVNGVTLPLNEKGYNVGDYRGSGQCWQFANHVYYEIWGRFFYQYGGDQDDMLRNYPQGEARRISADNAKMFISAAPTGSVIRIQSNQYGADTTKSNRHSLILLDKTETGCTVYHDWAGYATISTFTWNEFSYEYRGSTDFGYFKYIKYPDAEPLEFNDFSGDVENELTIK